MRRLITLTLMVILLPLAPLSAHEIRRKTFDIRHPWVRATPKGTATTAGYVKITNIGKSADRLIGATLEGAAKAELHQTVIQNGVASSKEVEGGILIEPGKTVELKPGGLRIMFLILSKSSTEDTYLNGTLTFEKTGRIEVEFFVEAAKASSDETRKETPPRHSDPAQHQHQ